MSRARVEAALIAEIEKRLVPRAGPGGRPVFRLGIWEEEGIVAHVFDIAGKPKVYRAVKRAFWRGQTTRAGGAFIELWREAVTADPGAEGSARYVWHADGERVLALTGLRVIEAEEERYVPVAREYVPWEDV